MARAEGDVEAAGAQLGCTVKGAAMQKTPRQEVAQRFSAASAGLKACATFLLIASAGLFAQSAPDINGDGALDLAAPSFEGNTVTVWLGR